MLLFLLGLLIGLIVGTGLGVRGRRHIAAFVAPGAPVCVVCGAPANPVKFHDGRYLCAEHKR